MGSQTQTALPKAPVPESDPARTKKKTGSKKPGSARRRKRALTPPKQHTRPAFLMEQALDDEDEGSAPPKGGSEPTAKADKAASKPKKTATKDKQHADTKKQNAPLKLQSIHTEESGSVAAERTESAVDEDRSDRDAAIPDLVAETGGQEEGNVSDPDLIELLEQLSETIDTANQVLSETPPPAETAATAVIDEYAAAGDPPVPDQPAPASVKDMLQRRSGTGLTTMTVAGLAVLLAVGGGFLWFNDNPSLMEGIPTRDMAATVTRDGEQIVVRSSTSADLNTPIPAVVIPLPPRKPQPGETVSRAAPFNPQPAIPKLPPAPQTGQSPATVQTAAAPAQPAAPATPAAGPAGQPIALDLTVPAQGGGQVSIMIQGVPKDAQLSAGNKVGSGTWVLEEKDLNQLALVTPASFPPGDVTLDVVMVRSDGRIPQSRSLKVAVQPGIAPAAIKAATSSVVRTPAATAPSAPATPAAPVAKAPAAPVAKAPAAPAAKAPAAVATVSPEAVAPANSTPQPNVQAAERMQLLPKQKLSTEEEARFLKRGEELLKLGDVASARLVLEHAARRDSTRAMTALAKTYDPDYLAKLGVRGVKPDIDQAITWYERASRKADR